MMNTSSDWPELSISAWKDTQATLHLWSQIVGKIRTKLMPWTNHSWHVTLYVTPRGLTTLAMPYEQRTLQIDFDFVAHQLLLHASDGRSQQFALEPMSVADFYGKVMNALSEMGIRLHIHGSPNEVDPSIPFAEDTQHNAYDAESVDRLRQALVQTDRAMKQFSGRLSGEVQSGSLLLGKLRLGGDAFLWPDGAAPSRRLSEHA